MDLRAYYQKIREIEKGIAEEFPIVVSRETTDGGKQGTKTEVSRAVAAKLIVEGLAELASPEESDRFRAAVTEAKRVADQVAAAAKMTLTVLSTAEVESLKAKTRGVKN